MMSRTKTNNVYKLYIGLYPETVYSIVKAYDLLPLSARQCTLVPLYPFWGCPGNVGKLRTGLLMVHVGMNSPDTVCVGTTAESGHAGNPCIAYRAVI